MTGDADLSDSDSDSNGEIIETDGFLGDVEDMDDERMMTFDGDMGRIDPADSDVVELNVQVDVSDMDDRDKQVLVALANQFEDCFTEVVEKNRDYGFSFLRTGCKLAATDGDPFERATRSQSYGLLTRSGDKRERVIENLYGNGDATVSDEPHVTAREMANYDHFLAFVLEHPELARSFLD